MFDQKVVVRFWNLVDMSGGQDDCWFPKCRAEWDRSKQWFHYPSSFAYAGKSFATHKFAYELTYGSVPDGLVVRHRCGYGCCCNPAHLVLGTFAQNAWDREARSFAGIEPGQLATYEDVPEYEPPPVRELRRPEKVVERLQRVIETARKWGISDEVLRELFDRALAPARGG